MQTYMSCLTVIHKQNKHSWKCINDQTEIAHILNDFLINIGSNLKNIAQKDHIFCKKYINNPILSSVNCQLIYIHSMDEFASAVIHHLISRYSMECQDQSCYVCQRQSRSWYLNRLLPGNHYLIPPSSILGFNSALCSLSRRSQTTHILICQ